ncbi:MAG: peptidoglycan DD-metalloendopeptidase family protein [Rhodobiaceae bacterium]
MPRALKQLLQRVSPPVLRSNSPDRPMVVRRQNWLLQETRFLFLTRKGPVEIILKPSLILGIGFVGLVGISVISATTLFVGFKSVEVVRNESITTAEASAPPFMVDGADSQMPDAAPSADAPVLATTTPPMIEPVIPEPAETTVTLAAAMTPAPSISWPLSLAATDGAALPPLSVLVPSAPRDTEKGTSRAPVPANNYAEPDRLIPIPAMPDLQDDHAAPDIAVATSFLQMPDIMSFVRPEDASPNSDVEVIAMTATPPPAIPEQHEAGLVPFNPDNNLPVVTDASRQYKLLRSMAREIRGIRESLSEIGLPETNLPEAEALDQFVETADFAGLAMAVEDHRSLLRKVPLKPPMLYFYISSNYGMRRHPVLKTKSFHHGIDLAGTWQETVHAPAPGTVIYAGTKGSFGKVVQVRHAYGFVTTYAHLAKITVRKGADVVPGTVVGKMGRTGRVDGAHLHYEIRLGDKSIDPRKFFAIGHRIGVGGELMLAADQP